MAMVSKGLLFSLTLLLVVTARSLAHRPWGGRQIHADGIANKQISATIPKVIDGKHRGEASKIVESDIVFPPIHFPPIRIPPRCC